MSIMMHTVRVKAILIFAAASLASLTSPAGAQTRNTISRLPTIVYLPKTVDTASGPQRNFRDLALLESSVRLPTASANPSEIQSRAESYLARNARELGLEGNAARLVVKSTRETLTGRYINLEQRLDGIPIIDGHIQMTSNSEGVVRSVARHVVDVPLAVAASVNKVAAITAQQAQDIVWGDLKVAGDLLEPIQTDQAYLNENNVLTLVYDVKVAVSKPFGYWEYYVDANTGRIAQMKDRRVKEDKQKRATDDAVLGDQVPVAPLDRAAALAKLNQRQASAAPSAAQKATAKVATGMALVFEPNPVSTLNDNNLKDGDAAMKFNQAYANVILEGLTEMGGSLHLQGPLVRIEDFEPGDGSVNRPPSTAVGSWTARRGDNAFNDVMTYYHIYNSLSYLRKLGYQGAKDLFPRGIAADSDGVDGDDNSHYVPGSDRLAFGHGCVDDNEDTDVILHELGHAIHYHINEVWGGGDSGAIGEGFGDYWAISQRMRMKNGLQVDPRKVFVWDGIDSCWGGRRADRMDAKYDPNHRYLAHQQIGNFASDELWSTPLVSSLFELTKGGESIDSVDQIVLEGMAGIGSNFTMRSLALAILEKAQTLFPGKPHAGVFEKHFRHHEIIK